jgi:iron complex transport system ATP-binding protein
VSLVADRLGWCTGGSTLLDDVSLHVEAGEMVAVMGPNGAGKSTLLRNLAGELQPASGEVVLNGRRLRHWPRLLLARQRAVLPQHSPLSFGFTVTEVVAMGRAPHPGQGGRRDAAIVEAAMRAADVSHLAGRRYPGLSGGERQRVHLARVLAQVWEEAEDGPRFLLLDEPTSALDLAHQHQVLGIVRDMLARGGIGALVILHDLNLAAQYADRLVLLRDGRLAATGAPAEVLDPAVLEPVFGLSLQVLPHPAVPGRRLVVSAGCSSAPAG